MYTPAITLTEKTVTIEYEGRPLKVPQGITVAAAVLGHGPDHHCRRSNFSGEKRSPYCLMGVCHECFMEINGRPYQQACMTLVQDGMTIKKQDFTDNE